MALDILSCQLTAVLSELVKRAIKYDDDGVDICFLSEPAGSTRKVQVNISLHMRTARLLQKKNLIFPER